MKQAVIVSAVRTAVGKAPKGTLRFTRPDDLGAIAVRGAVDRVPMLDPREIEDVIIGCAMPEGEQGLNMARLISLRAGLPIEAAAMTVNRYCASGLQTVALAAERIRGGGADVCGADRLARRPGGLSALWPLDRPGSPLRLLLPRMRGRIRSSAKRAP